MRILKALSLILVLLLSFSLLSVSAFAARPYPSQPTTSIYNGILTYRVSRNSGITITKCDATASGIVEIPSHIDDVAVTSIGDYAFQHCTEITGVIIPETVTGIGYSAFYGCTALKSIDIPRSVNKIEYAAFYNCKALKTATISDLAQWCAAEKDGEYANPAHITGTLLLNGTPLTEVTIPNGVATIEDYTFYGCKTINLINIPDSVTTIGECAFYGCEKLDKMVISAAVSEIGDGAFSACDNVTVIDISSDNKHYKNIEGCLVEISSKTLIKGFNNGKIPADGSVTTLGEFAFSGCEELTAITVPDCVEVIGARAFSDCQKLQSITLPKNLTAVRAGVFAGCTELAGITLPNTVETVGVSAFSGCTKLTGITLPEKLAVIQRFAFANCTALTEISIPASVDDIGEGVFEGCSALISIKCAATDKRYGNPGGNKGMLYDWKKNILIRGSKICIIPDFATKIDKYAFSGCADMEVMGIPASVTAIDFSAFEGCNSLKTIYYGGQKEDWDRIEIIEGNEILENVQFVYGNAKAPVPVLDEKTGEVIDNVVSVPTDVIEPQANSSNVWWIVIIIVAAVLIAGAVVLAVILKCKKTEN